MGDLKDQAKKNSNWLMVNIGDSTIVKYLGYKVIPSTLDPTKETIQYKLLENGMEKYWTNGSSKVMLVFDALVKGEDWVKISRVPFVNTKTGTVDSSKSTWLAEKAPAQAEKGHTNSTDEKAWDEK